MKKTELFVLALLSALIAFGFVACGSEPSASASSDSSDAGSEIASESATNVVDGNDGEAANVCAPACSLNLTCENGRCVPIPTSRWSLVIERGEVSELDPSDGVAWDIGGSPDIYVCLYIARSSTPTCTTVATDTRTPTWNFTLPSAAASDLRSFDFEIWENDAASNDVVCARSSFPVVERDFANRFEFGCPFGGMTTAKIFARLDPL